MKKQIFAVCDLEAEYARNFMDYLNQKKNIPFEIQAFTNVSSFVAYAKENPVELLLISAEAMCREVGELDIGKIVILTEGSKPEELDKYADVYKYQASSDIVREVIACYGAEKAVLPAQMPALKKTTELLEFIHRSDSAGRHPLRWRWPRSWAERSPFFILIWKNTPDLKSCLKKNTLIH